MTTQEAGIPPEPYEASAPAASNGPGVPAVPVPRDTLDALPSWRLRPGVAVTELRTGVHLRGWITSVTVEGGTALPVVWRHLADACATNGGGTLAREVPPGTPLREALVTVLDQLVAHDLLVERKGMPPDGATGEWLSTIAHHPAEAAGRLRASRVRLRSASPRDPLALAAARAFTRAGIETASGTDAELPDGHVLLTAPAGDGTRTLAVAVGLRGDAGFVTPVGEPVRVRREAAALARRLGASGVARPGGPSAAMGVLVASAGAQRLMCAVAGLRDPSEEVGDARLLPGRPAALVARSAPLRGEYRTWLGPGAPAPDPADDDGGGPVPPRSLAEALACVAALGDDEVGVLDAPAPGALPQLPAALVACAAPDGGRLLSGAARADLARLEAVCRSAELGLGAGAVGLVVGANEEHARGRALRRLALTEDRTGRPHGPDVTEDAMKHPQARHWWSVLVRRLGVDAEVSVRTVAGTGGAAYRAIVRRGATGPGVAVPVTGPVPAGAVSARPDRGAASGADAAADATSTAGAGRPARELLGAAVEATPGDAAAFAALSAVVRVQAAAGAPGAALRLVLPSGASASLAATAQRAPWEHTGWTSTWLADIATREAALRKVLTGVTGVRLTAWRPPDPTDATGVLWSALRQCGFAVLSPAPDPASKAPQTDPASKAPPPHSVDARPGPGAGRGSERGLGFEGGGRA